MPENELRESGKIKVEGCIDDFHSFVQLHGHGEHLPTVYCTKCGTPITYKIEGIK